MSTSHLFVSELAFISDRLQRAFEQHAAEAAQVSFKDVQQFQSQLCAWGKGFLKPPHTLVAMCSLDLLIEFYSKKLDFSVFEVFPPPARDAIRVELAAYAAREALDTQIGFRLRSWVAAGLRLPKWTTYAALVDGYYKQTVGVEKQERITAFVQALAQEADLSLSEARSECVGSLFFEVDEIRLMSAKRLENHLAHVSSAFVHPETDEASDEVTLPTALRDSLVLLGLTEPISWDTLKSQYRQLAFSHHPDKGGDLKQMQRLNAAYQEVARYLRVVRRDETPS